MAGVTRALSFSEGVEVGPPVPITVSASGFNTYATTAAYEAANGAAAEGNCFADTTLNKVRYYDGTNWTILENSRNNFAATVDPAVTDDDSASPPYSVGSVWINTTASPRKIFQCVDASTGAAVWNEVVNANQAQTISGAKTFSAVTNFTNATNATDKDTGAIVTEGGIGIEQDLFVGGDATVTGNFTVNGTTTTVNTSTLDVTDANITVNKGGNQASADDTSGITVEMSDADDAVILYDKDLNSKWKIGDVTVQREVMDVSSAQNVTNKFLFDISTVFANASDTSKQLIMDLAANSASGVVTFTFNSASAIDKYNFISTGGTTVDVLTADLQQIITNKDIDGGTASNTSRMTVPKAARATLDALTRKEGTIVYDTDSDALLIDDGTTLNELSGGAGGINFIDNGKAEAGTTGWSTFDDAGSYVDGTGGSPSVTWTRVTSTPLRGKGSFRFTKPAADSSGEGVSYDYTIDEAHKAEAQRVRFYYKPDSNYVDEEMEVRVYDVTNSSIIVPVPAKIQDTSLTERPFFEFQSSASGTSYRISFVVVGTSATAYTVDFDEIEVGPKEFGSINQVTDWVEFTPAVPSTFTASINRGYYRRVGDTAIIRYNYTLSSVVSGNILIDMPSGLVIDSNKLTSLDSTVYLGECTGFDSSAVTRYNGQAYGNDSTSFRMIASSSNSVIWNASAPFTWASGDIINAEIRVPIVGWSSGTEIQNIDTNRIVASQIHGTGSSISIGTGVVSQITFFSSAESRSYDLTGIWSDANDEFTVRTSGYYRFHPQARFSISSGTASATPEVQGRVYVDNAFHAIIDAVTFDSGATSSTTGSIVVGKPISIYLNAGQTVDFRILNSTGATISVDVNGAYFSCEKILGPQQVTAAEKIVARYNTDAGQSISNVGQTIVDFEDKVIDTHNAVTTGASWKFTAPANGIYKVVSSVCYAGFAATAGDRYFLEIFYNGGAIAIKNTVFWSSITPSTNPSIGEVSTFVEMSQGDTIDVRSEHDDSVARNLIASSVYNYILIERL